MKRRLAIGIPLVAVLLLLATFLVLRATFNEARLLALLQPRLEAALGRPVSVEGARLRAWPLSVALRGIEVQEGDGANQTLRPLLRLGELQCRVDAGPLLRRRLVIQSLLLDSLRVHLRQAADSTWNVAQTSRGAAKRAQPATTPATPMALSIRTLQIRHAVVELDQASPARGMHLPLEADLQFETDRDLRHVSLSGDVRCNAVQGRGDLQKLQDLDFRLTPRMSIDVPDSTAQIEELGVQIEELHLALSGALRLQQTQVFGTLHTQSTALDLARVLSLVPRGMVPALQTFEASGKVDVDLAAELRGRDLPNVEGTLQLHGGTFKTPELPEPLQDLQAELRWQDNRIDIERLAARFGADQLQLTGVVHDPLDAARTRYDMRLQGTLSLQAASALATLPPGTALDGQLIADCKAAGRVEDPESVQLTGTLQVRRASITSPQTRQPVGIDAEATLTGNALRIDEARLTLGKSTAKVHGQAAPLRPGTVPALRLEGRAASLDLDALLPEPAAAGNAAGSPAASAAPAATTQSLLPPHPASDVDVQLDVAAATYQLARWSGIRVNLKAGPGGFEVQAKVDSMQRDALRLQSIALRLKGDSLQAQGSVDAARSTLGRVRAHNLHSQVQVHGTQVDLPDLTAMVYSGTLRGHSTLDLGDARAPRYQLSLDMQSVQAGALLADVLPSGQWMTGTLQGSSTWSSSGAEPQTLRSNLTASGQAISVQGTLNRFPLVDALTQKLNMKEIPNVSYSDLGVHFNVQQGQVEIPELHLVGPDLSATSQGKVGLTGKLDLALNVVLSEESTRRYLRGDIGRTVQQLFADPQGRLVLDFNVGGTLKAPQLQANLKSTAARTGLRSLGNQELERLLEGVLPKKDSDLGDALRRGLGDLLGGKDRSQPSPPDTTRKR